jgi:hypothetical protein
MSLVMRSTESTDAQQELFAASVLPDGFVYPADFLTPAGEAVLLVDP